jgi:hypothetical protein
VMILVDGLIVGRVAVSVAVSLLITRAPLGTCCVTLNWQITDEPVNRYQPGCAVGRSKISFRVRRRGLVTANAMTSATSEGWMASRR